MTFVIPNLTVCVCVWVMCVCDHLCSFLCVFSLCDMCIEQISSIFSDFLTLTCIYIICCQMCVHLFVYVRVCVFVTFSCVYNWPESGIIFV